MTDFIKILPIVSTKRLRSMVRGETFVFYKQDVSTDRWLRSTAFQIGMKITQKTAILTDPLTLESVRVLLVTCIEPAKNNGKLKETD